MTGDVLGYDYTATRFESTLLEGEFNFEDSRDRESESVHFDVDWKFADRTSLFGRIQRTETSYDRVDSELDSTGYRCLKNIADCLPRIHSQNRELERTTFLYNIAPYLFSSAGITKNNHF